MVNPITDKQKLLHNYNLNNFYLCEGKKTQLNVNIEFK